MAFALLACCFLAAAPAIASAEEIIFSDTTAEAGLDFHHFIGASGEYYFPEITGAGGALFDFDGDGDLDLYLVQGAMLGTGKSLAEALFPVKGPVPPSDRLYRNDLAVGPGGKPRLRFTDVTAESGLSAARGYGMGVAVGDYDGDGRPDLYVTNFGSNQMWRNRGPGAGGVVTFEDTTAETGTDDPRWSVPAAFLDFDRDGRLDLFVGNYVAFGFAKQVPCLGASGARDYCGPKSYPPVPDRLFRNRGDGAFEDVTGSSGIGAAPGPGLGVVVADFDGDGWTDVYVANDGAANFLWINRRDGTFEDEALFRGCALDADGRSQAGMGVDLADFDGDGDEDLFITHLVGETNTLYVNDGGGLFRDASAASGLATPSWNATGFGTAFFDYDNDGWLDVVAVNGAVKSVDALRQARDPYPYHQPDQLFRNLGPDPGGRIRFEEVTARAGQAFARSETGRGAIFGDLDNDGDTDLVISNSNGPARLLLNEVGAANGWVGLAMVGASGSEIPGTRVEVLLPGRPPIWRRVRPAASYASSIDPRVLVGLGAYRGPVTVRAHWPGGRIETWTGVASGRYTTLLEGSGTPVE